MDMVGDIGDRDGGSLLADFASKWLDFSCVFGWSGAIIRLK